MTATSPLFAGRPAIPPGNFEPMTTYGLLVDDFVGAWDALALADPAPDARANFLFGNAVMVIFEFICRAAAADSHDQAMNWFASELATEDQRYFLELPEPVSTPRFKLPRWGPAPRRRQLLALLFDTIRNGQSHQGQQAPVYLAGGGILLVALDGVRHGTRLLDAWPGPGRPNDHLKLSTVAPGRLRLVFRPDIFFLDVTRAAARAQVLQLADTPSFLRRELNATAEDLEQSLRALT